MPLDLPDLNATEELGQALAGALAGLPGAAVVTLTGELGTGKTTLVRSVLRALGHQGPVVSPTYTLVEPYEVGDRRLCHVDLYRLGAPEELEYIGLRELAGARDWLLVEWPEQGGGYLPAVDIDIALAYHGEGRSAGITTATGKGKSLAASLARANRETRG